MSEYTPVKGILLGNKTYDRLKFIVQVVLPGVGVLYASLAQYWGFPNVEAVVGTLAAFALFFGLLLGLSSKNFTPRPPAGTPLGEFVIEELPNGKKTIRLGELNRDPADVLDDDVISFVKVTRAVEVEPSDARGENSA